MNFMVLVGKLQKNPEVDTSLKLQKTTCKLNILSTPFINPLKKNAIEITVFRCVATGALAERIIEKCKKGDLVMAIGNMQNMRGFIGKRFVNIWRLQIERFRLLDKKPQKADIDSEIIFTDAADDIDEDDNIF